MRANVEQDGGAEFGDELRALRALDEDRVGTAFAQRIGKQRIPVVEDAVRGGRVSGGRLSTMSSQATSACMRPAISSATSEPAQRSGAFVLDFEPAPPRQRNAPASEPASDRSASGAGRRPHTRCRHRCRRRGILRGTSRAARPGRAASAPARWCARSYRSTWARCHPDSSALPIAVYRGEGDTSGQRTRGAYAVAGALATLAEIAVLAQQRAQHVAR